MTRAAHLIEGTARGQPASIEDVGIDHRGLHVLMPQQFLHRPDVITMREQMRGNAVPNGVAADAFGQPRRTTGQTNGQLPSTLTGVMPADAPGSRVSRSLV